MADCKLLILIPILVRCVYLTEATVGSQQPIGIL